MEKDDIPLEKLAQHFEAYNRSEGKSPRTIELTSIQGECVCRLLFVVECTAAKYCKRCGRFIKRRTFQINH